jgi:hypothetical protein
MVVGLISWNPVEVPVDAVSGFVLTGVKPCRYWLKKSCGLLEEPKPLRERLKPAEEGVWATTLKYLTPL